MTDTEQKTQGFYEKFFQEAGYVELRVSDVKPLVEQTTATHADLVIELAEANKRLDRLNDRHEDLYKKVLESNTRVKSLQNAVALTNDIHKALTGVFLDKET